MWGISCPAYPSMRWNTQYLRRSILRVLQRTRFLSGVSTLEFPRMFGTFGRRYINFHLVVAFATLTGFTEPSELYATAALPPSLMYLYTRDIDLSRVDLRLESAAKPSLLSVPINNTATSLPRSASVSFFCSTPTYEKTNRLRGWNILMQSRGFFNSQAWGDLPRWKIPAQECTDARNPPVEHLLHSTALAFAHAVFMYAVRPVMVHFRSGTLE